MKETEFFEKIISLPQLKVESTEIFDNKYIIHCYYDKKCSLCPNCLAKTTIINQYEERKFRDLQISNRHVWLYVRIPQFRCTTCNRYFFTNPDWVVPGKSYTKRQQVFVFELCKNQSFKQAAAICDMSSRTVERLFYEYVNKRMDLSDKYRNVRKLGIDEIAYKKGKKDFACVLTNLETGEQLDILPFRNKDALLLHFQELGIDFCNQIEVVSCDMWAAYTAVALECFPNCEVVIDRFHIVKLLNEVLDKQRKDLRKEDYSEPCFKYLKWILFKQFENCSVSEKAKLKDAFEKSQKLEEVYQLRESFNILFEIAQSKDDFSKLLDDWLEDAKLIDYSPLTKFTKTVRRWKSHIITFAKYRITNAATEGKNNIIRFFQRISFGMQNLQNLKARVFAADF